METFLQHYNYIRNISHEDAKPLAKTDQIVREVECNTPFRETQRNVKTPKTQIGRSGNLRRGSHILHPVKLLFRSITPY